MKRWMCAAIAWCLAASMLLPYASAYEATPPADETPDVQSYTKASPEEAEPSAKSEAEATLFTTQGQCGNEVYWSLLDGILTISGSGGIWNEADASYVPWYGKRDSIRCVNIENGVTYIGQYAFYSCTQLTSVTIPAGVTAIGELAFYQCSSLTSVTLPEGLMSIGNGAFSHCAGLSEITIPGSVTSIGGGAFSDCSSLPAIAIPNGVTNIGSGMFANCSSLTNMTIPNGVTSIGDRAFAGCSSLTNITIPSSVTKIGESAFSNCSSLKVHFCGTAAQWEQVTVGKYNSDLLNASRSYRSGQGADCEVCGRRSAISGSCGENAAWKYDDGVLTISGSGEMGNYLDYTPNWADFLDEIKVVRIENGITSIGPYAFNNCGSLTSVTIPDSVTSIGPYAFNNCSSLTSVTIPDGVTRIGGYTFACCRNLSSITIPDSVTYIDYFAFAACINLTHVTIPNSVTGIGENAFYNCTQLQSVHWCGAYSQWIGISMKTGNELLTGASRSYYSAKRDGSCEYCGRKLPVSGSCGTNVDWSFCNGVLTISGIGAMAPQTSTSNWLWFADVIDTAIIESGVTNIAASAFNGCSSLTSITIPDSATSIGYYAFERCSSLTSITIPDSVTSIGDHAFDSCSSLTSMPIPDGVTGIGGYAFSGCSNLTSVTIPDGVTRIYDSTFSDCVSLTSVVIPDSVTHIDSAVFSGCSSLTSIHFCGTAEQWDSVVKGYGNSIMDSTPKRFRSVQADGTCKFCGRQFQTSGSCGQQISWVFSNGVLTISGNGAMTDYEEGKAPWEVLKPAITKVVLDSGVSKLGNGALTQIPNLKTVEYHGTEEEWEALTKGNNVFADSVSIEYSAMLVATEKRLDETSCELSLQMVGSAFPKSWPETLTVCAALYWNGQMTDVRLVNASAELLKQGTSFTFTWNGSDLPDYKVFILNTSCQPLREPLA